MTLKDELPIEQNKTHNKGGDKNGNNLVQK